MSVEIIKLDDWPSPVIRVPFIERPWWDNASWSVLLRAGWAENPSRNLPAYSLYFEWLITPPKNNNTRAGVIDELKKKAVEKGIILIEILEISQPPEKENRHAG